MAANKNVRKNTYKVKKKPAKTKTQAPKFKMPSFSLSNIAQLTEDRRFKMSVGLMLIFISLFTAFSLMSFPFSGKADQSIIDSVGITNLMSSGKEVDNWLGLFGAILAHFLVYYTFGLGSVLIIPVFFVLGYKVLTENSLFPTQKVLTFCSFFMVWVSVLLGYYVVVKESPNMLGFLCGNIGYLIAEGLSNLAGWGTVFLLLLSLSIFIVYNFRTATLELYSNIVTGKLSSVIPALAKLKPTIKKAENTANDSEEEDEEQKGEENTSNNYGYSEIDEAFSSTNTQEETTEEKGIVPYQGGGDMVVHETNSNQAKDDSKQKSSLQVNKQPEDYAIEIKFPESDENIDSENNRIIQLDNQENNTSQHTTPAKGDNTKKEIKSTEEEFKASNQPKPLPINMMSVKDTSDVDKADIDSINDISEDVMVEDLDQYDPKLDLSNFKFPDLDLLNNPPPNRIKVTEEELKKNQGKIVETLKNFKIGIRSISATIGPTVTLYEIVPEVGIKISKIRSLEDDIALSLSALGIRIIAPIPGKGTIGIEVPNENKELVTIKSVLATKKFVNTENALPIALGRTISNEVFVTDLAKMPHLLMAGATGQGKSVGINVILTSLLYKKHPSELKFVMIDPKKVELSLFNVIENHYLASLPDAEEAIITDTNKAIYVLNSLCIEMDSRYDLLKKAGTRNVKEYNTKFKDRKLNPNKGHRFLPYIVLVIDELADLMMTAGKEIEAPIARLAQLARAIGIHLVVATQRPSVDVITGMIKANFPARLSFRVTSKIDSRTILDGSGADQLIGQGDMLLSNGNEMIRLQCAFVSTDEVEKICTHISKQQAYSTAYMLPEFEDESSSSTKVDTGERDELFEEAARLLVRHQQGSTSLIQRKLSLGYNRAGRIIDQLEAAGIVGPFEGSKARQVLVPDEVSLQLLLNN